jgi:surfeit locus 1 family protein
MDGPSYAFARRPRWLVAHVLVLSLVVLFVNLGFWQLRRLEERRDRNELVESRVASEPVDVTELPQDPDDARFQAVTASGAYDPDRSTTLRTTQNGVPGGWVFSALDLGTPPGVVVLRGFVGTQPDGGLVEAPPPEGEVTVEGIAIPVTRLERSAETAVRDLVGDGPLVLPVVIQAQSSDPPDAPDVLTPVPVPDLGEGPHLSYAVQWFLFAAVAVLGYPLLLRHQAREAREDAPGGPSGLTRGATMAG